MLEKDYTEQCSEWMAERLEALIEYMQYGHAAVAYMKQDGTFKLVKGTLVGYEKDFGKQYDPMEIKNTGGNQGAAHRDRNQVCQGDKPSAASAAMAAGERGKGGIIALPLAPVEMLSG